MDEFLKALSFAFWLAVMDDLVNDDEDTRLWLDTGREPMGFLWWCEVTGKQEGDWRKTLLLLWGLRGTKAGKKALQGIRDARI